MERRHITEHRSTFNSLFRNAQCFLSSTIHILLPLALHLYLCIQILDDKAVSSTFEPRQEEVTEGQRKAHNEEILQESLLGSSN
jgi:hypothetical protein